MLNSHAFHIISDRAVVNFSDVRYRPSVCRPSDVGMIHKKLAPVNRRQFMAPETCSCIVGLTFVRPTQPVEIFGNISTSFGILDIRWHSRKIFTEIVPNLKKQTLRWGGLNARQVAKYCDFGAFNGYMSETVQDNELGLS